MTEIDGFDIEEIKEDLFTAVVGDVMDKVGLTTQFLPPQIRPLDPEMVVLGRAMTVVEADVAPSAPPDRPFGRMMEALDDLHPGEVYVCSGSTGSFALWGELMSERARHLGAAGAVVDGYSRDTDGVLEMGFPTFSYGGYAQDSGIRGHVTDFRVPITIGQVTVQPGDLVFGDRDGVCVVPAASVREVLTGAFEKVRTENLVRRAISDGMSAVEAFDTYGVL